MTNVEPKTPQQPEEPGAADERFLNTAEMMVGTAMMFIGFLNIFLSISGGFEMAGTMPMILYFTGLAIWAHASIKLAGVRYAVMATAVVIALAFFHYGEVLFWHKQVVFWATVLIVVFFMFKSSPKPS
jgi:hypothetical protein